MHGTRDAVMAPNDDEPFLGAFTMRSGELSVDGAPMRTDDVPALVRLVEILARRARDAVVAGEDVASVRRVRDADWRSCCAALLAEEQRAFTGWTPYDRARCFEILVALRGYEFSTRVPDTLAQEPADVDARAPWLRAMQGPMHARI